MCIKTKFVRLILLIPVFFIGFQQASAQDHFDLISEEYLREIFEFGPTDSMKFSECEEKSYNTTCEYVWGVPSDMDASLLKNGLSPDGSAVMAIYAQTSGVEPWQRVLSSYTDAEEVADIGIFAVWSEKRGQLSLMNAEFLVIHVNVRKSGAADLRATALTIVHQILSNI